MAQEVIVNRVAQSGIITLNLENYLTDNSTILEFDLKSFLFKELLLKEKDYRLALKELDWSIYEEKSVAIFCSSDAIIPVWAFMLPVVYLTNLAKNTYQGTTQELKKHLLLKNIEQINGEDYQDKIVVIKGCGDDDVSAPAYTLITEKLKPYVKSLMYGEPCSTVPLYKKKRKK